MPISILKYFLETLEHADPGKFQVLQKSVRAYIKHEELCELIEKIDPEKREKRYKSDTRSLMFISRMINGLLHVETCRQIVQWLQQVPQEPVSCGGESSSASSSQPDDSS